MRSLLVLFCLASLTALAGELTPDQAAAVRRDRQKAIDDVAKKYGNKKSSELSAEERRQMIRDQNEAVGKVLEKHNVDAKELARWEASASSADRSAAKDKSAALDKQEADAKKAAEAKAAAKPDENGVIIERGNGEKNADADFDHRFDDAAPAKKKKGGKKH